MKTIESFPMNAGDGTYSYSHNSSFQKDAAQNAKEMIEKVITEKLDILNISSTSKTFNLADLGCSIGPNTFICMQNVIENIENKYKFQGLESHIPEFHVFFSDHTANDFNTLFSKLPPEKQYFAAGVPGSFHGRLFPKSSLHFVHSSYAVHWLSKVPEEVLDETSCGWNKGMIHYGGAKEEVTHAYRAQFHRDMDKFFKARAEEVVVGGMVILIMPSIPNSLPHSEVPSWVLFDVLGSSLVDMAAEGIIDEAKVDSFNLPIYFATPHDITELVEKNGRFSIEILELMTSSPKHFSRSIGVNALTMHMRAGFETIISKHFGNEIIDELFQRFSEKANAPVFAKRLDASYVKGRLLFVALKRI